MANNQYLHYSSAYFWEWGDEGEVLALRRGRTIAYSAYVEEVLDALCPRGLPAFGSVLLAIYATNGAANAPLAPIQELLDERMHATHSYRKLLPDALLFLERLQGLPAEWRRGANRLQVLAAIFEKAHNRQAASRSRVICVRFSQLRKNPTGPVDDIFPRENFHNDFRTLELLNRHFPTEKSIIDAALALPEIEAPDLTEIEQPGADLADKPHERDYLDELLARPQSFHVAALVRSLWSGLHIPHHQAMPSRQPLGGVSDIANKGSFDRLLLSEFANDDTVFLSRLANSEALFLNREIPPEHNNRERVLLIDVSVRNWGTPRTLAYALLLAIARHPRTDIPCRAFAVGNEYRPILFDTPLQLIESLQWIDAAPHPVAGLQAFLESKEAGADSELLFISASELTAVAPLQQLLHEHRKRFSYWAYTDAAGSIELYQRQGQVRRFLQRLNLPLGELWTRVKPPREVPVDVCIEPMPSREQGFELRELPILLPAPGKYRNLIAADKDTALMITRENEVLRNNILRTDSGVVYTSGGWELIASELPVPQGPVAATRNRKGELLLAVCMCAPRRIVVYNLHDGSSRTSPLKGRRSSFYVIVKMVAADSVFYLRNNVGYVFAVDWESDDLFQEVTHPRESLKSALEDDAEEALSSWPASFLENLRSACISTDDQLLLNGHAYRWISASAQVGWATLLGNRQSTCKVGARRVGGNRFQFVDGSSIRLLRNGVAILRSSSEALPDIYIGTALERRLSMAAGKYVAGEPEYLKPGNQILPVPEFQDRFIQPFIQQILNHAADHSTE